MDNNYFEKNKKRVETLEVQKKVPAEYRMLIWQMIDALKESMIVDYIQYFVLESDAGKNSVLWEMESITHTQNTPVYSKCYRFPVNKWVVDGRITVTDEGDRCVMRFEQ